ncbi:hypothetical protein HMPREF1487_09580 [Pseudomonas sp. HPB0071]|uniref:hypothetical protein n=1 Tax=Pseudomonas TaxID=286 RepID=UPI0002C9E0C0|nr:MULTISPECIES: hypothetical protein [Pseudomonas]ENA26539.1 hypothetical protein HMPREF1487_09580 [Pseudomonas sp. HPB0071]
MTTSEQNVKSDAEMLDELIQEQRREERAYQGFPLFLKVISSSAGIIAGGLVVGYVIHSLFM